MYEFLGEKLYEWQFYAEAEEIIGAGLDIIESCEKGNDLMGKILCQNGDFTGAREYFLKLTQMDKNREAYKNRLQIIDEKIQQKNNR